MPGNRRKPYLEYNKSLRRFRPCHHNLCTETLPGLYMKKTLSIIFLCLSICGLDSAQSLTDSNLPIMIISTDNGAEINDSVKVFGSMKVICRPSGERNYMTDQNNPAYLNYNGRINIKIRGQSTQYPEKKQYSISTYKSDDYTKNNVNLLGMPGHYSWVINAMGFDTAFIRDYLTYNLSRQIGEYASRTAYCEVVINGNYKGLYVLQEKVKADINRVNVISIGFNDNSMPAVTGGYITKCDKPGSDPIAWIMESENGQEQYYIHVVPKPKNVTQAQNDYICSQFRFLAATSYNNDISVTAGYPSVIDIPSFVDYMIIEELASNPDAYQYSTFFHKDRNGKLRAGPVWDNDLTYGNDLFLWGYDRSKPDIWQFSNGDNEGSRFWLDLFNSDVFRCQLSKRWNELIQPGQPLNLTSMETFIDQAVPIISEAVTRNDLRWNIADKFQKRIADIKSYLATRIDWMTANLGSYSDCSNVPVPPLVITKIMYNPPSTVTPLKSEDQEFIEITNNGDQTVDLTGIYFSGTGFVYQFPANSTILPHASIILASNTSVFKIRYGFVPFGQFTRNLSDKGQNLVMVDGYGNIIDNVNYADSLPWPDANGNGYYLKLIDPDLDNNDPSNWVASNLQLFNDQNIPSDLTLQLFPNPVKDILEIQNGTEIKSISIYDVSGSLLFTMPADSKILELDMSRFARGIYLIKALTTNGSTTKKVVKN